MELLGRHLEDARLVSIAYAWEQATAPRRAPATTPSLQPGFAARIATRVHFPQGAAPGAGGGAAWVDLSFERATGNLDFRLGGVEAGQARALVLRHGDAGAGVIVERLALSGVTEWSGTVRLDAASQQALVAGDLHLQLFPLEGAPAGWISRIELPL
jgi:hypothetical protein